MSGATCATLAQVMPVFLVALTAERIVFKQSKSPRKMTRRIAAVLARTLLDLAIAIALVVATFMAVAGVENEGLKGDGATTLWNLAIILTIVVVYRWLLLSTPIGQVYLEATRGVIPVLERGLLDAPTWLVGAASALVDALIEVVGGGVIGMAESLAHRIMRVRVKRDEKPEE